MNNAIHFQDVFPIEYQGMIEKYAQELQKILASYDVVIFMARKAICLYKALLENKEIEINYGCRVISSRVITFNIAPILKGKRIAVVDDVVVKGKSISFVMSCLNAMDMDADVYVMAYEKESEDSKGINQYVVNAPQYLDNEGVNQFSNYITKYINLSGITYNIDFPVFKIMLSDEERSHFFEINHCQNLTDGVLRRVGNERYVLHLQEQNNKCHEILGIEGELITKIRFYYNHNTNYVTAVPFVLLPQMKTEQLTKVYEQLMGDSYDELLKNPNDRFELENKFKVLQYVLSDCLLTSFINQISISCIKKSEWNETLIFSRKIESSACKQLLEENNIKFNIIANAHDSYGELEDNLSTFYDYLLFNNSASKRFTNGFGNIITDRIIYKEDIKDYFCSCGKAINICSISCLLDLVIDKGILVPSIVHCDGNSIVRAYKLGEIYQLHKQGIALFHFMLYRYFEYCNEVLLGRTVLEKLCVLFLKKTSYVNNPLFKTVGEFGDDCFSIGFSKFGPRVSNTDSSYSVHSYSALSSVMEDEKLIETKGIKKRYKITKASTPTDEKWNVTAEYFALDYYRLQLALDKVLPIENIPVKTYKEFLTLLSIGPDKKSQIFSLVAELNIFSKRADLSLKLPEIVYELDNYEESVDEKGILQKTYMGIMDGIASGVWKYKCFTNKDLVKTVFRELLKVDSSLKGIYADYINLVSIMDKNELYDDFIQECGELLVEIGIVFDRASLIVHEREGKNYGCQELTSIYYPGELTEKLTKKVELIIDETNDATIVDYLKSLKEHADYLIDKCDLFIAQVALKKDEMSNEIFVIYDPKHVIPTNAFDKVFLKTHSNSKYYSNLESCYIPKVNGDMTIHSLLKKYMYYASIYENILFIKVSLSNQYHGAISGGNYIAGRYFSQLVSNAIDNYYNTSVGCQYMAIYETINDPEIENQLALNIAEIHHENQFKYLIYNVEVDKLISESTSDTDGDALAVQDQIIIIRNDCERTKGLVSSFISKCEKLINDNGNQIDSSLLKDHMSKAKDDELILSMINQHVQSNDLTVNTIRRYSKNIENIKEKVLNEYAEKNH